MHLGVPVEVLSAAEAADALALRTLDTGGVPCSHHRSRSALQARRRVALAFATSVVSGVAVYVNAHGVSHFDDATVYTTAKNAVAGIVLLLVSRSRPCDPKRIGAAHVGAAAARARRARGGRRQRPVRPLLRGALARVGDAGGVHPQDARRLGRAARGTAPARATRAATRARDRPRRRRAGLARRWGRNDRVRQRRGDDPRRDAALGRRGDPRQAARDRCRAADARRRGWHSARRCWSGGSLSRAVSPTSSRSVPTSGGGRSSPACCSPPTSRPGTRRSRERQAVDVTAVLVFGAVVTALLAGAADGVPLDAFGLALVTAGVALAALALGSAAGRRSVP